MEFILLTHVYCLAISDSHNANPFKGKQSLPLYWLLWVGHTSLSSLLLGRIYGGPMSLGEWNQWSLVAPSERSFYRVYFAMKNAWEELEWSHQAIGRWIRMVAWASVTIHVGRCLHSEKPSALYIYCKSWSVKTWLGITCLRKIPICLYALYIWVIMIVVTTCWQLPAIHEC